METTQQRMDHLQGEAKLALQKWYGHLPENCEMRVLASRLFRQAVEYLFTEKSEQQQWKVIFPRTSCVDFNYVLDDTRQFLEILRAQLNPLNPSSIYENGGTARFERAFYLERLPNNEKDRNPEEWVSFLNLRSGSNDLLLLALLQKGKDSQYYWPIDGLNYICSEYLQRPWLQCAVLDRLLVCTMIYQSSFELGQKMTYASFNPYTEEYKKRERKIFALTVVKLLVAGLVGLGAANTHGWWAGLTIALVFMVLFEIYGYIANKKSSWNESSARTLFNDIASVFEITRQKILSIDLLRERLAAIDGGKGNYLPDEIFSILDSATGRGVVLWGLDS